MKKLILLLLITTLGFAQAPTKNANGFFAGTGTMNASAIGQFDSASKGFLFPRMTTTQRNAIASPATSLVIFNTTTGAYNYWNGTAWTTFGGGGVPTLDQVLTEGNTSDKSIILDEGAGGFRMAMDFGSTIISITENSSGNLGYLSESGMVTRNATNTIFGEYGKGYMQLKTTATSGIANIKGTNLTSNRNYELPNASGTIALTSDIPTIDATPTDGSANAVSSNGVFDALALRKKVIVSDVTSATVTGTTSLTLAKTYEVTAGTLSASGFLNLFMYASRTGASNSYTMGIYINTSNNFGTATLITSIATSGNFSPFLPFKAQYVLKNNLLIGGISNQTSGSNYVNSITQVSVACNNTSNSVWLFIGITPTNSGSSIVVEGVEILN
jgi:hypothetical protein